MSANPYLPGPTKFGNDNVLDFSSPESQELLNKTIKFNRDDFVQSEIQDTTEPIAEFDTEQNRGIARATQDIELGLGISQGNIPWALTYAAKIDPKTAAKVNELANDIGLPEHVVERNQEEVDTLAKARYAYKQLQSFPEKEYPLVHAAINHPKSGPLAVNNVDTLAKIEYARQKYYPTTSDYLNAVELSFAEGIKGIARGTAAFVRQQSESILPYVQQPIQERFITKNGETYLSKKQKAPGLSEASLKLLGFVAKEAEDYLKPAPIGYTGARKVVGDIAGFIPMVAGSALAPEIMVPLIGASISGETYSELINKGVSQETANKLGMLNGIAQTAFMAFPAGKASQLLRGTGTLKTLTREAGAVIGLNLLLGPAQSLSTLAAMKAGEAEKSGAMQAISDFMDTAPESVREGLYNGALMSVVGVAHGSPRLMKMVRDDLNLQRAQAWFNEINSQIQANPKLREDVSTATEFIDMASDGSVKSIFVPVESVNRLKQDPVEREKFLESLDAKEKYQLAIIEGTDIEIPAGKYSMELAGTPEFKALADEIRIGNDNITIAQNKSNYEKAKAEIKEIIDNPLPKGQEVSKGGIKFKEQLLAKGIDEKESSLIAQIAEARAARTAQDTGTSIEDVWNRWGIEVTTGKNAPLVIDGKKVTPESLLSNKSGMATGEITYDPANSIKAQINLFKGKDRSTLIHEMSHLFFLDMEHLVKSGLANEKMANDFSKIQEFLGAKEGEKLTAKQQESLAYAYESYFMEGKAPSIGLIGAFKTFSKWIKDIYRKLSLSGMAINDEIRAVFDRMLASDEEIYRAMEAQEKPGEFDSRIAGTEKEKQALDSLRDQAESVALEKNFRKYWNAFRNSAEGEEKIFKEAETEVENKPVYQVIRQAKERAGFKTSDAEKYLTKEQIEKVKESHGNIFSKKGTIDPEFIAGEKKYNSVQEMFNDLVNSLPYKEAVKAEFSNRMAEKEAQLRNDLEDSPGIDALHNDASEAYLVAQIELLRRKAKAAESKEIAKINREAMREEVDNHLANMTVNEASGYTRFSTQENRWADKAFEYASKGEMEKALQAKQNQLLQHMLVKASVKIRDRVREIEAKTARLTRRERVEFDWKEQVKALAERFGLRGESPKDPENLKNLGEMIDPETGQNVVDAGLIPEWMMAYAPQNYKLLKIGQLEDVYSLAKSMVAFGSVELKSAEFAKNKTVSDAVDAMVALSDQMLKDIPLSDREKLGFSIKETLKDAFASAAQVKYMLRELDGGRAFVGEDFGLNERIEISLAKAQGEYYRIINKEIGPFQEKLINKYFGPAIRELNAKLKKDTGSIQFKPSKYQPTPEMMREGRNGFTAEELLMLCLNYGNKNNRKAIMEGYRLGEEDLHEIASLFSESTWRHIQEYWNFHDSLFPKINEIYKRQRNNTMLKEPRSMPFEIVTSDGKTLGNDVIEGGYHPIILDQKLSGKAMELQEKALSDNIYDSVFRRKSVSLSSTNERTGTKLPPLLSGSIITKHFEQVAKYLSHTDVVSDVQKIIRHEKYADMFRRKLGNAKYEALLSAVNYVAKPDREPHNIFEKFLQSQNRIAAHVILGLNLRTALKQLPGIFNGMREVGIKDVIAGYGAIIRGGHEIIKQIDEWEPLMEARRHTVNQAVSESVRTLNPFGPKSITVNGRPFTWRNVQDAMFYLIRAADAAVNYPLWMGAYLKARKFGKSHERSIEDATQRVIGTQQTANPIDLSKIQRSQILKTSLLFFSWSARFGNMLSSQYRSYREGNLSTAEYMNHIALDIIAPSIFTSMLVSFAADGEAPDAKDMMFALSDNMLGPLPFINQIPQWIKSGQYDGALPATGGIERSYKLVRALQKQLMSEDDEERGVKTLKAFGDLADWGAGVPLSRFINVFSQGSEMISEGKTSNILNLFVPMSREKKKELE